MGFFDKLKEGLKKTKEAIDKPQNIYPKEISNFRFFILSDKVPITNVVTAAVIALHDTIKEISVADALNIL